MIKKKHAPNTSSVTTLGEIFAAVGIGVISVGIYFGWW